MDISKSAKLVSPAYSISMEGIKNPVIDVRMETGGIVIPVWSCNVCMVEIPDDLTSKDIGADCQVCGRNYPVESLNVHSQVTCICDNCISEVKKMKKEGSSNVKVVEYCDLFNLGPSSKFVKLLDVLKTPVNI